MKKILYFLAISISMQFELSMAMQQVCSTINANSQTPEIMQKAEINKKELHANADFLLQSIRKTINTVSAKHVTQITCSPLTRIKVETEQQWNDYINSLLDRFRQTSKKHPCYFNDRVMHIHQHEFSWNDIKYEDNILKIKQLNTNKSKVTAILSENLNFVHWIDFETIISCQIHANLKQQDLWYVVFTLPTNNKIAGACCVKTELSDIETIQCSYFRLVINFNIERKEHEEWIVTTLYPIIKNNRQCANRKVTYEKHVQQTIECIKQNKFDNAFDKIGKMLIAGDFSKLSTVFDQKNKRTLRETPFIQKFLQYSCMKGNFNAFQFLWHVFGFGNDKFVGTAAAFWPQEDTNLEDMIKMLQQNKHIIIFFMQEAIRFNKTIVAKKCFDISETLKCGSTIQNSGLLDLAAKKGNVDIVDLFLKTGADVNALFNNMTPLASAAENGHTSVVERLLAEKNINLEIKCKEGKWSPLLFAARYNHYEVAELLLKKGADPNTTQIDEVTALMCAAYYRHDHIVKLLITHKADIHKKSKTGQTAILSASKNGGQDIVELLIEHGACINEKDSAGFTPLIYATKSSLELQKSAQQPKTKKTIPTKKTASKPNLDEMKLAIKNGSIKIIHNNVCNSINLVKFLLEKGADPSISTSLNGTAFMFANTLINLSDNILFCDMAKLILEHEVNLILKNADPTLRENQDDIVDQLMNASKILNDINQHNSPIQTLLMLSAACNNLQFTKFVLQNDNYKKSINVIDYQGNTALIYAIFTEANTAGNGDLVQLLLEHGADPTLTNSAGKTAAQIANDRGFKEIERQILTYIAEHPTKKSTTK